MTYEIMITEEFTKTYRVEADNKQQAADIIEELFCRDEMDDCTSGDYNYERNINDVRQVEHDEYNLTREGCRVYNEDDLL